MSEQTTAAVPQKTSWVFVTCWRCDKKFSRRAQVDGTDAEICLECQLLAVACVGCGIRHDVLVPRGRRHGQA